MKRLLIALCLFTACQKDDNGLKQYQGQWTTSCSPQAGKMSLTPINDNEATLTYSGACLRGSVKAAIIDGKITIPYQASGEDFHQGTGTISEDKITINGYRFTKHLITGNQTYIINFSATK